MKHAHARRVSIALAAVASVTALALAGCAPSGGATTSESGTTGKLSHSAKGSLNYWGWQSAASIKQEIAEFNKVYPNIKVTYKQLDNAPKYNQELTPGLLSNSGPDIFMLPTGPTVDTYKPYAKDLTALAKQELGDSWKSKLSPLGVSSFTRDGKLVAAATGGQSTGTWLVNKTLLDKLGLKVPTTALTLEELKSFCKTVTASGAECLSLGGQVPLLIISQFHVIADSVAPGKYAKAVEGKIKWTDPDLEKAFTIMKSMFDDGIFQAGAAGAAPYPDVWQNFLKQKAAMTYLGTWSLTTYDKKLFAGNLTDAGLSADAGFTAQLIPAPDLNAGKVTTLLPTLVVGDAVNAKAKNAAPAEAYVAWKDFSKGGQQVVANSLINIPSLIGITPNGLDFVDSSIQKQSLSDLYKASQTSTESDVIDCPDMSTALNDALQKLGTGASVSSAVSGLDSASSQIDTATCK